LVHNKTPSSTAIYLYADTVFGSRAELWRLVGGEYFSRMWAKKIWTEHVMSENLIALKERLAERALDLCEHLFPEGHCRYGKFYVGDLDGNPGRSLVITVDGGNVGLWKDFATGVGGSNLLELLHQRNGGQDFVGAIKEAREWLESGGSEGSDPRASGQPRAMGNKKRQPVDLKGLVRGTRRDVRTLAELLVVGTEALEIAMDDGVLRFFDHPANGRCWSVLDASFATVGLSCLCSSGTAQRRGPSFVRQDRRLDGKPFVFSDGSTGKGRTVGSPSYPVGRPAIPWSHYHSHSRPKWHASIRRC
jgi:hypothetical protein